MHHKQPTTESHTLVIARVGYGGLAAARRLGKCARNNGAIVIDQNLHHRRRAVDELVASIERGAFPFDQLGT